MAIQDYYRILGVSKAASLEEIKHSYHKLAKAYHPDKVPEDEKKEKAEEFALISKAYNILKDKEKRTEYDNMLAEMKKKIKDGKVAQPKAGAVTSVSSRRDKAEVVEIADKAFRMGVGLFNDGKYSKAIEYLESAVRANKDSSEAHMFLALAYAYAKKSVSKAVDHCHKAIDLDPWNVVYKLHLGKIYKMAGVRSLAEKTFRDVLNWEPDNKEAKYELQSLNGKSSGGLFDFVNKLFQRKK